MRREIAPSAYRRPCIQLYHVPAMCAQVDAMDDGREAIDGGRKPWLPCPERDLTGMQTYDGAHVT